MSFGITGVIWTWMFHSWPVFRGRGHVLQRELDPDRQQASAPPYLDATIAGGFQVPSPGGKIDGGSFFGQYRRITR